MSAHRFPRSWLLSAVGCGCVLSALLWRPPFRRELLVCGMTALLLAMVSCLRRLVSR